MGERMAETISALPDHALQSRGPVSSAFVARGCSTLREAAAYLEALPYGRNVDPSNEYCVLDEGRGTCSTKHALLARLLAEEGVAGVDLYIGIYEMNEANTPGVGAVLARYGLTSIPEAHCYLRSRASRIDVTRLDFHGQAEIQGFLFEEVIRPDQVGDYKRAVHRRVLAEVAGRPPYRDFDADTLWVIREECIHALSSDA